MEKAAVFFDFDDTLINTTSASNFAYDSVRSFLSNDTGGIVPQSNVEAIVEAYRRLLSLTPNDLYKSQTPETIRSDLWQQALSESLSTLKNTTGDEASNCQICDLAKALYHRWYTTRLQEMNWLELETVPTLMTLRQKYKLVLITNGSSIIQWEKIKRMGTEQYFDHVLVSGDEPYDKPHESIFLKACKLSGTSPEKCIMIGDNVATDILGANRAGLLAAILFQKRDTKIESSEEDHSVVISDSRLNFTVSSIIEIPSLLERIFERRKKSH